VDYSVMPGRLVRGYIQPVMEFEIDAGSGVPPFEQLRAQIAGRAATGTLPAGTRLPTVRRLAADLGLAANTVARAYRELEADGVVVTEGRRGTFVSSSTITATPAEACRLAEAYVESARRLGLTCAEATRLVERAWS
jgi:DNA-binding transcriptional regulator YhcF (GntR family)